MDQRQAALHAARARRLETKTLGHLDYDAPRGLGIGSEVGGAQQDG
jgi:hypothetical protein